MNILEYTPSHAKKAGHFHREATELVLSYPRLGERYVFYPIEELAAKIIETPLIDPAPPNVLAKIQKKIYKLDIQTADSTIVEITSTSAEQQNLINLVDQLDRLSLFWGAQEPYQGPVIFRNDSPDGLAWILSTGYLFFDKN